MGRNTAFRSVPAGFTLLEVMISVGLLTAVSLLMYQSISITMRAREEVSRVEDLNHCAQVLLSHLKADISMAYVSNHVNPQQPASNTVFIGREDSLLMSTFSHERRRRGSRESDQAVVEYRTAFVDGENVILRREKAVPDENPEKGGVEDVIAVGVGEFRLSYWDDEKEDWVDEWKVDMKDARKAGLAGGLSELVNPTGAKFMKQAQEKMLREYMLPSRVYIRVVLEDSDGNEYPFETQVPVHIRAPLNF